MGNYTGQRGIHGFWESRLPELFGASLRPVYVGTAANTLTMSEMRRSGLQFEESYCCRRLGAHVSGQRLSVKTSKRRRTLYRLLSNAAGTTAERTSNLNKYSAVHTTKG